MARTRLRSDREELLTPGDLADLYKVSPRTVTRWAAEGRIESIRTPGGHYRFPESVIDAPNASGPALATVTPDEPLTAPLA